MTKKPMAKKPKLPPTEMISFRIPRALARDMRILASAQTRTVSNLAVQILTDGMLAPATVRDTVRKREKQIKSAKQALIEMAPEKAAVEDVKEMFS